MKKILIILLFLASFSLFGCSKSKGFTKTIYVFDTTVTIYLYEGTEDNLNDIVDILNKLHKLTDAYHPYEGITNIYTINEAIKNGETSFEIDWDLASILLMPKKTYSIYDGGIIKKLGTYEDVIMLGIGNLTNIWKEAIASKAIPQEGKIQEIVEEIDSEKYDYTISSKTLTVDSNSNVCFDVGSVTKGYAATKIKEYLGTKGINKYMIDFGQSTILLGEKANGKGFNVGVNGTNYVIEDLSYCFVGTASVLEQKPEIDGKIYHHIIDPKTGYPTNTYDTVVVVSNVISVDYTDLLATFLMIRPEKAHEIASAMVGTCGTGKVFSIYFFKDGNLVDRVGIQ